MQTASGDRDDLGGEAGATVVDERVSFSLVQLCAACGAEPELLVALVHEGVLEPAAGGAAREHWRFGGDAFARARTALRLARDLQLDAGAVALVLDLLDEISALRAQLRRLGAG